MDQKTWLWSKKPSEKTNFASNKAGSFLENHGAEEIQTGKEIELERCVKDLREHLDSLQCDCNAKDELTVIHAKMAEEAIAGREKAEAEILSLKQQLEEALKHGVDTDKRLIQAEAGWEEYVQKVNSVQEECEQRICDAITEASKKHEKAQKKLEDRLTKTSKRLGELVVENMHLSNALLMKEKLVEDLHKCQSQAAAELNALMARLDATEKENAFLKYEFHMLNKDFNICREELECNRQAASTLHKQHLEGVKKISKLEAECHRLRLLQQQHFPGPAALAELRSEVEMLSNNKVEMRRRNQNMTRDLTHRDRDLKVKNSSDISKKELNSLYERLIDGEQGSKTVNKISTKNKNDIHSSVVSQKTSKRAAVIEARAKEFPGSRRSIARCSPLSSASSQDLDTGNEDLTSSCGSMADALVSELEHLKFDKQKSPHCDKSIVVPEMSLMDDFVEMEKLAIVSMDLPSQSNNQSGLTGNQLIPVLNDCLEPSDSKQVICSDDFATEEPFDWLQHVLNAMLKESRITKRSMVELLDDVKIALGCMNDLTARDHDKEVSPENARGLGSRHSGSFMALECSNLSSAIGSENEVTKNDTLEELIRSEDAQSNARNSIQMIINLIERFNPMPSVGQDTAAPLLKSNLSSLFESTKDDDYSIHVFRWNDFEFRVLLQQFVCTCRNLLVGKADFEKFVWELAYAFDWTVNNCANFKDASTVRDKMKDHILRSEINCPDEIGNGLDSKILQSHLQEENKKLNDDLKNMELAMKEVETTLQSALDKNEDLMIQVQELEKGIGHLRTELEDLQESKGIIEDQIENQKLINEDLDTQLTAAKAKLSEVLQKFSTVEVELEDKYHCCEELEATCLDLQLQLECTTIMDDPTNSLTQDEKQPLTGWEIVPTSVKMPESQETYLELEKRFNSLALTKESTLFDKFSRTAIITAKNNFSRKRPTLRSQLLAEDNVNPEAFTVHNSREITGDSHAQEQLLYDNSTALAIVTTKKKQRRLGLLWQMFMTKKRSN